MSDCSELPNKGCMDLFLLKWVLFERWRAEASTSSLFRFNTIFTSSCTTTCWWPNFTLTLYLLFFLASCSFLLSCHLIFPFSQDTAAYIYPFDIGLVQYTGVVGLFHYLESSFYLTLYHCNSLFNFSLTVNENYSDICLQLKPW